MSETANIDRVGASIAWIIGARTDNFAFEIDDDRFSKFEIAQSIIQTEAELVRDFAEAYHAERTPFLTWAPAAGMDIGDVIPAHIGQVEGVRIYAFDDDLGTLEDTDFVTGKPTSQSNIDLWQENYRSDDDSDGIFDEFDADQDGSSLTGYYNLTNLTLDFLGTKAQVRIVTYQPIYPDTVAVTYGTLQISSDWEAALVAGTIAKLVKIGVPNDILQQNTNAYVQARSLIRGDAKPEIDDVQRMP